MRTLTRREACAALAATSLFARPAEAVVRPAPYDRAIRNPLMGFRPGSGRLKTHPWGALTKWYTRWNEIEDEASDGVERIRAFSNARWAGLPELNVKVIPRVYLEWPNRGKYWPSDMETGDYSSAGFRERVVRLIQKIGEAWDGDSRVAFVEVGLIGYWGEHHHPEPDREMQKLIGDAFVAAFPNKLLMNRYPWHFEDYPFGIYWDSFGHPEESVKHLPALESPRLATRWQAAPMGGETAFDWGTPLGKDPTDAVINNHEKIVGLIRRLHWNHVGWLADYDTNHPDAARNGELIQSAFGYRFELPEVRYTAAISPGARFGVSFTVRNTGSTPLYYRWPVEASLLDSATREPVWQAAFPEADVRTWMPGGEYTIEGTFDAPPSLADRQYVLALAILDPAGNLPSARFATANYWKGGRHPIGLIGAGGAPEHVELTGFDELADDRGLHYAAIA